MNNEPDGMSRIPSAGALMHDHNEANGATGRPLVNIRCATAADVQALTRLGRRIHAETRFRAYDYDMERVAASLNTIVDNSHGDNGTHCAFLAEDEQQEVAGILIGALERPLFSEQTVAKVIVYYVFPERRMRGTGRKLLAAFRKWGECRSAFEICVGINSAAYVMNTHRFLTRIGFEPTGGNYSVPAKSVRPPWRQPWDE